MGVTASVDSQGGLRRAAAAGVRWTSTGAAVRGALGLVQIAILARLLEAHDFGLVATVNVVVAVAAIFSDLGLNNAIIARQTTDRAVLSSLYWANVVAGLAIFVLVLVAAPIVAGIFDQPALTGLLQLAAAGFLAGPLGQQFQLLLQRDLRFDVIAKVEVVSTVAALLVAVATAATGAGAYAIVWSLVAGASVKSALFAAHGWRTWRPRLGLRLSHLRGYTSFGLYQIGDRVIAYVAANIDYILIGYFLGTEVLGAYYVAYQLVLKPLLLLNPPLTRVAFPIFAKRGDDDAALARGFLEVVRLVMLMVFPLLAGVAVAAEQFVPVVFGDGWERSVVLIQILSGVGMMRALSNPIGSVLLAKNRPDISFKYNVVWIVVLTLTLRIAVEGGVVALAWAYVGIGLAAHALWPLLLQHVMGLSWRRYLAALAGPIGYTIAVAGAMEVARVLLASWTGSAGLSLVLLTAVGAATYVALLARFEREYMADLWRLMAARAPRHAAAAPA